MSTTQKRTIAKVGSNIEVLLDNPNKPNAQECYSLLAIKSVIPTYNIGIGTSIVDKSPYPYLDQFIISINFHNEHANPPLSFDIQSVTNQPGWTADLPGLIQAVTDICGWITAASGGGAATATEATLQAVLTSLNLQQDFEIKLVRDTGNGNKVVCEVIEYDEQTDTYTYSYKDVGGVAYVPVGPLEYLDPSAVLTLILSELQAVTYINSSFRNTSVSNTALPVKAGTGNLYSWNIINPNILPVYVKFYDKAAAGVTVGTDVPVKTLMVPAGGSVFQETDGWGIQEYFTTAISIAITTGLPDTDNTAPASGVHVELKYK